MTFVAQREASVDVALLYLVSEMMTMSHSADDIVPQCRSNLMRWELLQAGVKPNFHPLWFTTRMLGKHPEAR